MDFLNQKGGVKRILLKGELKIFQQRGAKLPLGHTLNWGVQMKKISFGGGKKNFSYGILNTCPRMMDGFSKEREDGFRDYFQIFPKIGMK